MPQPVRPIRPFPLHAESSTAPAHLESTGIASAAHGSHPFASSRLAASRRGRARSIGSLAVPVLPVLVLAACSGGSGGTNAGGDVVGGENSMFVQGCSLGCSPVGESGELSCESGSIFVNQEISVLFTEEVDLDTVDKSTFQVIEFATGKAPTGTYVLDPTTPGRVIFRPQLTFDSSGTPIFGLIQGQQYVLKIPGSKQDQPPYIQSVAGHENLTRLECIIVADKGVNDPVTGPVTVEVTVDVVTAYDAGGNPIAFDTGVPANGAVDVFRDSPITFEFDDIMNPATLVNPVTQSSDFLTINVDPDGDTTDSSDQVPIAGSFSLNTDQELLRTTVIFTPEGGIPSAGSGPVKRKVVVFVPASVVDLGGTQVSNAGEFTFTPEVIQFDPVLLPGGTGEDFSTTQNRDPVRSGAPWGGGMLAPGLTGGAGYLGDLLAETGQTVVLCTDADCSSTPEAINTIQGLDVLPLGPDVVVPGTIPSIQITDGVYQFASVIVRAGSILGFAGATPPRIYSRGDFIVQGQIDAAGQPTADDLATNGHKSDVVTGGAGGVGGPGGGDGGAGGDRPDNTGTNLIVVGGIANPGAVIDGQPGEGIGGAPSSGGGPGGIHWPPTFPTGTEMANWNDFDPSNTLTCHSDQVGTAGGGGAYATDGGLGTADPPLLPNLTGPSVPTPDTPGGDSSEIGLGPLEKTLDPGLGFLRGGSGGGGGGASIHLTRTNGNPLNCGTGLGGAPLAINSYRSHSGAGGGSGGGAIQCNAGGRAVIDGTIDASGGDGGRSFLTAIPGLFEPDKSAPAGGGGSGGAILLQSPAVQIGSTPGRLSVEGGAGGDGVGGGFGGDGGTGLVRLEGIGLQAILEAQKIAPFDPGDPESSVFLSVDDLEPQTSGPAALSGAQSCWSKPVGNFFTVAFAGDVPLIGGGTDFGWDMLLVTNVPGLESMSFRGDSALLGDSIEAVKGSDLLGPNPAPLVVRFQGARLIGELVDPCNVIFEGAGAETVADSLTGWVRHPEELNTYWDFLGPEEAAKRQPNMVRFQIIFDKTTDLVDEVITGVDSIYIKVQPD